VLVGQPTLRRTLRRGSFAALDQRIAVRATLVHAARGLPRQIGNLAVAALIAGYTRNNRIVDHDCATAAVADHTAD